jgi:hypothetical protein
MLQIESWSCESTRAGPRPTETKSGREASATSSRWTQIAMLNCSAGKPVRAAEQCFARTAFEHAIWRSEVRLKGAANTREGPMDLRSEKQVKCPWARTGLLGTMAQRLSPDISILRNKEKTEVLKLIGYLFSFGTRWRRR